MDLAVSFAILALRIVATNPQSRQLHTFLNMCIWHLQLLTLVFVGTAGSAEYRELMETVAFPMMTVSLAIARWVGRLVPAPEWLEGYLCLQCGHLFLWTFLLSLTALSIAFSTRDRRFGFLRLSVFNLLCVPDAVYAVSSHFCHWGSGLSYWHATFTFATSIQWTVFSLIAPVMSYTNYFHWNALSTIEYKDSFKIWAYALRAELVAVVYFQHFAEVWFKPTPGLAIVMLVLMLYIFKKLQEIYWPYTSREANLLSEDCYTSAVLLTLWKWFQKDWLLYVGLLYPLRQLLLLRRLFVKDKPS